MKLTGLKILVTGGRGYVGSHTAKLLQLSDAEVYIIDNRYVKENKVSGTILAGNGNYDDPRILDHVATLGIDGIIHCAGTSLVGPSVFSPSEYYNNNVIRTIRMLDHVVDWNKKPFIIFSSSAAVYGNPSDSHKLTEDLQMSPSNPYGNTKMMIECILKDYGLAYGLRSFSFRYFNAAGADIWGSDLGPEPDDTHLIPRIFKAFYAHEAFNLYGDNYNTVDGTCVRDYIHVCDLAAAHHRACEALAFEDAKFGVYNLGTNNGYSNQQVIDAFVEIVGGVEVVHCKRRTGDPDTLVATANKFKELYGWEPKYSDLKTIMISFKNYYEKQRTQSN